MTTGYIYCFKGELRAPFGDNVDQPNVWKIGRTINNIKERAQDANGTWSFYERWVVRRAIRVHDQVQMEATFHRWLEIYGLRLNEYADGNKTPGSREWFKGTDAQIFGLFDLALTFGAEEIHVDTDGNLLSNRDDVVTDTDTDFDFGTEIDAQPITPPIQVVVHNDNDDEDDDSDDDSDDEDEKRTQKRTNKTRRPFQNYLADGSTIRIVCGGFEQRGKFVLQACDNKVSNSQQKCFRIANQIELITLNQFCKRSVIASTGKYSNTNAWKTVKVWDGRGEWRSIDSIQ
jgi:hypothetical protein